MSGLNTLSGALEPRLIHESLEITRNHGFLEELIVLLSPAVFVLLFALPPIEM